MHEEHAMLENYDGALLRRLLKYAKKHLFVIGMSLLLLILVVGLDLLRPIILGRAVDEVIVNYKKVYSVQPIDDTTSFSPSELIEEGKAFELGTKVLYEDENNTYPELSKATVVYDESGYYLVSDISYEDAQLIMDDALIEFDDSEAYALSGDKRFKADKLSEDEIGLLRQPDLMGLINLMIIFIVLLVAGLIVSYYQTILLHYTGQKIIYEIREEVFEHIQGLSVEFFNQNPVGKLVTRVTNDTETLNEMYTSVIVNSVKSVLTLIGISVMMFVLNWQLSLVVFTVIPLVVLATFLFRHYSRQAYREVRTKVASINAFLSEHISGMKIVQIFAREKAKLKSFDDINEGLLSAHFKQLFIFSIYRPSMYFIYVVGLTLVMGFGGYQVINNVLTIGVLIIFLQYISNFFDPIQQLSEQFNILQSAFASAEKIFSLLDEKERIEDADDIQALENVEGKIEFRNVWFAYKEDEYVLRDISFTVEPGETVAFVGATGAGKTSILNLLSRYYEIQQGQILIDGKDIKTLGKQDIRKHVGQMLQDVFLFTGNISENIRLGDETIDDTSMEQAAKHVNAHPFIDKLSDKYDEHVYERGATFSAGQRQLLSFARTLAYDPQILVLDEATANIDTETEILIQDALEKLMEGRTTLVVAHRLSTIQHADKIVVLHKGMIREIGNHQELLSKRGLYYNLYQLQF